MDLHLFLPLILHVHLSEWLVYILHAVYMVHLCEASGLYMAL